MQPLGAGQHRREQAVGAERGRHVSIDPGAAGRRCRLHVVARASSRGTTTAPGAITSSRYGGCTSTCASRTSTDGSARRPPHQRAYPGGADLPSGCRGSRPPARSRRHRVERIAALDHRPDHARGGHRVAQPTHGHLGGVRVGGVAGQDAQQLLAREHLTRRDRQPLQHREPGGRQRQHPVVEGRGAGTDLQHPTRGLHARHGRRAP